MPGAEFFKDLIPGQKPCFTLDFVFPPFRALVLFPLECFFPSFWQRETFALQRSCRTLASPSRPDSLFLWRNSSSGLLSSPHQPKSPSFLPSARRMALRPASPVRLRMLPDVLSLIGFFSPEAPQSCSFFQRVSPSPVGANTFRRR